MSSDDEWLVKQSGTTLVKYEGVSTEIARKIEDKVRCGHIGGASCGDMQERDIFFSASRISLECAFADAQEMGLKVRAMTPDELKQDKDSKYAKAGFIISSPGG